MTDVVDVVVVSLLVVGDDVLISTGTNGFSEVDISFIDGSPEVETSAKVLFQLSHILKNSLPPGNKNKLHIQNVCIMHKGNI